MKKLLIISSLLIYLWGYSQVAIGKSSISSPSVSLEFGNIAGDANAQKGIILP